MSNPARLKPLIIVLFVLFSVGIFILDSPQNWLLPTVLTTLVLFQFWGLLYLRSLGPGAVRRNAGKWRDKLRGLIVLAFLIWYLNLSIDAGWWYQASMAALLLVQSTYTEWLRYTGR